MRHYFLILVYAPIPFHEDFEIISSFSYIVEEKGYMQKAYYNNKTLEAILTNPAHLGYAASTTLITPEKENQPVWVIVF